MEMTKITKVLILACAFFGVNAFSQQAIVSLPRDARNTPYFSGIGLPFLSELTIATTSYDDAAKITLPNSGQSLNRVFNHFWVWNASTTITAYFCFGTTAAGCTTNHVKVRPNSAFVDDFAWFGDAVGTPYIFYKASASDAVDVRVW